MRLLNKQQYNIAFFMVLALTLNSDFVFSQEGEPLMEEVLVTGSRITTVDGFGATSPVTIVTADNIQSFGYSNIEQVLNNLPSIETSQNAQTSNGSTGTASIDLRGLGVERTLVLINGRRLPSGGYNTPAADVSQVPTIALERVDVLTGGASATYGADAVAGVVNFVTRRMNGIEIRTGWSGYHHENDHDHIRGLLDAGGYEYPSGTSGPDGEAHQLDIVMGSDFEDGRGNATVYMSYRNQEALRQASRDYAAGTLLASGDAIGGSATAPIPNFYIFGDGGNVIANDGNYAYTLQSDGSIADDDGSNLYNYGPQNFLLRPIEQYTFGSFFDYKISDYFTSYTEVMYSSLDNRSQLAESGTFFQEQILELNDFPQAFQRSLIEQFDGIAYDDYLVHVGKRNVEGGPRSEHFSNSSFRIVTGLKGDINDTWLYDMSYMYAETRQQSVYLNDLQSDLILQSIDPDLCVGNCVLYDVFTPGGVTAEAAAGVQTVANINAINSTKVLTGFVTGDLFSLSPTLNPIQVVIGYEWREERVETQPDAVAREGLRVGSGGPTPALSGSFNVTELFGEAKVPVLDSLIADLAYRYSDYSTVGGENTYRLGFDWAPINLARFRIGYNRAVRAPNIFELYEASQLGLWRGVDPCSTATPEYSLEQCLRTGVTPEQYGTIGESPASQYHQVTGGNLNLETEDADTITAGVVLTPSDNLSVSLDYWSVEIEKAISDIGPENIVRQCAENGSLCESIVRSPTGSLWLGQQGYVLNAQRNIGNNDWKGIDLAGSWTTDALGGTIDMKLIGTYMLAKKTEIFPGEFYDCVGLVSSRCYPSPKWRHTVSTTYDSNSFWAVTARWRYFDGIDYDGALNNRPSEGVDKIAQGNLEGGENYLDLNATFRIMRNSELLVGVNNILDKEPPLVGGAIGSDANIIPGFYDSLGRYLFAQATFRF